MGCSSHNPYHSSCFGRNAMKRLIAGLALTFVLAACTADPVTPVPPGNGDGNGNPERPLCDDGRRSLAVNAQPIEFGQTYESTSGLIYFYTETDTPTRVTLRLDNLPDYGFLDYRVLNGRQQSVITGHFSDRDGPIPSSAVFTGEIEEAGAVFVRLNHIPNLDDLRCAEFQFMLTRE